MSNHKRIIGVCWIVSGLAIAALAIFKLGSTSQDQLPTHVIFSVTALSACYMLAGYAQMANFKWAHWLCVPFAIFTLPNLPLGTFISAYYLWYFARHEWKRVGTPPAQ